jgi:choline dehydrogenase-like flavoprotein
MTEQNNNLEDEISDSYDYIIVGLGAGGSVVAELLAINDPSSNILVM